MRASEEVCWQALAIAPTGTHHLLNGSPTYHKRFHQVLAFHAPGVAPVIDETGAYHIGLHGEAIYDTRFTRTFGYYCKRAAVHQKGQWFHITEQGSALYLERYLWCGNYQSRVCAVKNSEGMFLHLDLQGKPLYRTLFSYVGDFREGAAAVQDQEGRYFHIDPKGERIHDENFLDLDVFHKGFARAKDSSGWFHIARTGKALYPQRYREVEPFYNGVARVTTRDGEVLLIDEQGTCTQTLRGSTTDLFHEVSADLVSYWQFYTLKAASDFRLFSYLPDSFAGLCHKTGLTSTMIEKLLLALQEMGYVSQRNKDWYATERGSFLHPSHPFSLDAAQRLWLDEHLTCWQRLTESLRRGKGVFLDMWKKDWFSYLNEKSEKRALYHKALSSYAKQDYALFGNKVDFSSFDSVADVGGGRGELLHLLQVKYPHLTCHLLDLPQTLAEVVSASIVFHPLDFFQGWPNLKVEAVILSRVIHDWSDEKAIHLLKMSQKLLKEGEKSRLYVIEKQLCKQTGRGGVLNLNMFVMTEGREREKEEFQRLFHSAGLSCESILPLNEVSSVAILKPR